jgi:predicted ferric reductase
MLRDSLPVPYEAWRISHGFAACALAAAGLHHAVNVGAYSDDITLAQLWIVMVALTFAIVGYLYLVKPWQLSQRPYYVSHVLRLGEGLWGVTLWPAKLQPIGLFSRGLNPKVTEAMPFDAGQFAWVTIGVSPFLLSDHPLSIASAPGDRPRFKFVIKETGDFSKSLGQIPVGTPAYLDGPYGRFTLSAAEAALPKGQRAAGLAFIADGVGIAPILSLLRDRLAAGEQQPMRLLYGNRSPSQIVYRDELAAMEAALDFRVRHVVSEPPFEWSGGTGELDGATVDGWIDWPDPAAWIYFVCGPTAMMDAVERALIARGVPARRIVTERFKYD